jgi:hypothetical protein
MAIINDENMASKSAKIWHSGMAATSIMAGIEMKAWQYRKRISKAYRNELKGRGGA